MNGGNLLVRRVDSPTHALLRSSIVSFAHGTAVTCMNGGTASVECSDVFGNSDGDWVGCLAEQQNLNDNFSADPLFCDAGADDLTIQSNSPCAPPGVTGCGLVGAHDVGCGPVSVNPATWASVKARYR